MKIDLHIHSKEYSLCGVSLIEEQIEAAIAAGLDAVAFSNHDRLVPRDQIDRLNQQYAPFKIFSGIEITVQGGEHILAIGLHDPALEGGKWEYSALHRYVRERGGFMVLNHPFRFNATIEIDYRRFPPDAIEAYSTNILHSLTPKIMRVAEEVSVPVVSNSDAHVTKDVGRHYNILAQTPTTDAELIYALKSGQFTPHAQ